MNLGKEIKDSFAIFCMATYGEGDPTDNAQEFYEWLKNSAENMEGLSYTVSCAINSFRQCYF